MTRRNITFAFMGVFFVALVAVVLWINVTRPRILVIHSYDTDYVWVGDVNEGFARVLDGHGWIDVYYHYMKTKKKSDKEHLRRAGLAARNAVDTINPDVIMTMDDYAQRLAGKFYVGDPEIKVVFGGVNGSIEPYGYEGAANVTGIVERKPARAIKEVVSFLHGVGVVGSKDRPPRGLFLADDSNSTHRDAGHLDTVDWSPMQYLGVRFVKTYDGWKEAVLGLKGQTDVLFVGGYRKLRRGPDEKGFARPEEVMTWTEANSPVPVIGMNVFNTEEGAMVSVGVSPFEQGEVMARMAVDIIEKDTPPDTIPVRTSQQYVISLRQSAMKRRGIEMPRVFEAFARATNNYFE